MSYILRKPKGQWGLPKVPKDFQVSYGLVVIMIFLGGLFPTFGVSVLSILLIERLALFIPKSRLLGVK